MDLSNSFFKAKIDQVRKDVVGKSLTAVNVPAAIIDRAVVKRNCDQMLAMCEKVGVGFRAHIKTHKVCRPGARAVSKLLALFCLLET